MTSPQETVERALALSRADNCVVIADEFSTANLRWANNTLTTNGVTSSRELTIITLVGQGTGSAAGIVARRGVSDDSLEALVRSAEEAARANAPAEDAQPLITTNGGPQGDWGDPVEATSVSIFSDFAPALGEAMTRADADGRLLFGFAHHVLQSTFVGSSTGLRLRHDQPTGLVEINAKSSEDQTRSAWAGVATRDFSDVDLDALDAGLTQRLGWAAQRIAIPAGRYDTVLPPSAVADLAIPMYWAAAARDAHDGRSAFSRSGGGTRVGDRLTDVPLSLRSDPRAPGLECAPFVIARSSGVAESVFDNGLPIGATDWIADGTLTSLIQTRHSAGQTGLGVTPAIDNLILEKPGQGRTLAELVADVDHGLLLTCLWYIREVDPRTLLLTGLTRDGVYAIERGEVVGAVNNFRFNESPVDLLGRFAEVGATEPCLPREWSDYFTRTAMPPVRVPDFNMSSVSQAS